MAIGTQLTGVNLRAEVASSYTPTYVGARGHTGSVKTDRNKGRNESGNVFRILGGADLRDTLNRKTRLGAFLALYCLVETTRDLLKKAEGNPH